MSDEKPTKIDWRDKQLPYMQAQPTYSIMSTHYLPAASAQVQLQQATQYVSMYPSTLGHSNLDHTSSGNHMNVRNRQHGM